MNSSQKTKKALAAEVESLRARLAETENLLKNLQVENSPEFLFSPNKPRRYVVVCDEKGCIAGVCPSAERLSSPHPMGQPFDIVFSLLHDRDPSGEDAGERRPFSLAPIMEGKSYSRVPVRVRRSDGQFAPMILEATPLRVVEGSMSGIAVTLTDLVQREALDYRAPWSDERESSWLAEALGGHEETSAFERELLQRKAVEAALKDSEARFRAIFEKAAIGIALVDLEGRPIAANPALLELFGGTIEDLPSTLASPVVLTEEVPDQPQAEYVVDPESCRHEHFQMEKRYILKDGRMMWCNMTVSPIRDADGLPHSAVVMLVDITERRKAEKALRQSEARYRVIVEDQVELVSRIRPDYTYSFVNEAYCRRFGRTRDDLIGFSLWEHVPPRGRQRLKDHYSSLTLQNPVATIQHRLIMPDGETLWQQWTDRAIFDETGRLKEIQSVGRDITREKLAEKALQESEKQLRYLSCQLLAAQEKERKRIAHELHDSVGQYLSAIKYGMENLLQLTQIGSPEMVANSLETLLPIVRNTIEEVRRIYMDLRPSLLDDLGIVPTISWFCREFETIYAGITIRKEIEIKETDIPESLKIVMFRILQEALNNVARHSYADEVSVVLKKVRKGIEFVVADNGRGFEPREAFARSEVKGGLGLASMKERTELFGGSFSMESSPGAGTRIQVSWPDLKHLWSDGETQPPAQGP